MILQVNLFAHRGHFIASKWIWMSTRDPSPVIDQGLQSIIRPNRRDGTFWTVGCHTALACSRLHWALTVRHSVARQICSGVLLLNSAFGHLQMVLGFQNVVARLGSFLYFMSAFQRCSLRAQSPTTWLEVFLEGETDDFLRIVSVHVDGAAFYYIRKCLSLAVAHTNRGRFSRTSLILGLPSDPMVVRFGHSWD